MSAIVFERVRKTFGRTVAVDRVDFSIEPGQLVGLIGHNGAGKTTCLSMLMGLLRPSEGCVRVGGHDVVTAPQAARRVLGAVPEDPALFHHLSARELFEFLASVRGGEVAYAVDVADLGADVDRPIREYSQGMRRRAALAAALLGRPEVIVLDEALNGLDPPSSSRVKEILRREVDRGATVLLSTHVVETVAAVADRVIMLAHGRVVADEDVATIGPAGLEALFLERIAATRSEKNAG